MVWLVLVNQEIAVAISYTRMDERVKRNISEFAPETKNEGGWKIETIPSLEKRRELEFIIVTVNYIVTLIERNKARRPTMRPWEY